MRVNAIHYCGGVVGNALIPLGHYYVTSGAYFHKTVTHCERNTVSESFEEDSARMDYNISAC